MSRYTEKTEIGKSDYFMLIGLLAVAKEHSRSLEIIQKQIAQILGEDGENGHAGDAIYGEYNADDLLRKSDIKVIENAN